MWRPTRTLGAKKFFVRVSTRQSSTGSEGPITDCVFTICGVCRTYGHVWGGVPYRCRTATRARARIARTREETV